MLGETRAKTGQIDAIHVGHLHIEHEHIWFQCMHQTESPRACARFADDQRRIRPGDEPPLAPSLDTVGPMAQTVEHVALMWSVLADGWQYATWVVGASRMREVDDTWPAVGSKLHHSVGLWPLLIHDNTEVEHLDAPREMRLKVRIWPTGSGIVTMRCTPRDGGTEVVMEEQLVSGPVSMMPKPLQDPLLNARNVEALRRLAYLAEGRAALA
mgnify:CR=1 FL=1